MKNEYYFSEDGLSVSIIIPYKEIKIITVIDADDFTLVNSFPNRWFANYDIPTDTFRVVGRITRNKKTTTYPLHRWILNPPSNAIIDHKNCDGLDNRRLNLKITDKIGNAQNRAKATKRNRSGLLGVALYSRTGKFTAQIKYLGKKKHLGYFNTKEEAHEAYLKARKELFGI